MNFMPFEKIFRLNNGELAIPGKIYVSSEGLELFESDIHFHVINYAVNVLSYDPSRLKGFDFFLGVTHGDLKSSTKMMDLFLYRGLKKNWKSNPEVFMKRITGGFWSDLTSTFGDTFTVLHKEGELIKSSKSLDEYLAKTPLGISGIAEGC